MFNRVTVLNGLLIVGCWLNRVSRIARCYCFFLFWFLLQAGGILQALRCKTLGLLVRTKVHKTPTPSGSRIHGLASQAICGCFWSTCWRPRRTLPGLKATSCMRTTSMFKSSCRARPAGKSSTRVRRWRPACDPLPRRRRHPRDGRTLDTGGRPVVKCAHGARAGLHWTYLPHPVSTFVVEWWVQALIFI